MAYKIEYEERKSYLYAHIEGPESYDEATRFWEELKKKAEEGHWNKFLIKDEVKGVLEMNDVFWLSTRVATLFYGKIIAYIDPKEESYVANQIGESVVATRGVQVRLFKNEQEAIGWLASISDDK